MKNNAKDIEKPEIRWMERIARGDAQAFRKLVERHQRPMLNLAFRYCGDRHLSEDLTQDIFLKVYMNASRWRPDRDFSAWLYRIAVNHCLNFRRGPQHRELPVPDPTINLDLKNLETTRRTRFKTESSPEAALSRKQETFRIQKAVSALPPRQRIAVILQRFHDLSYREIAFRMDCSEKAVESLLVRAYGNLKKHLARPGNLSRKRQGPR